MSLWSRIAYRILDRPAPFIVVIVVLTAFLGYGMTQVRTDHTAGNFTSEDDQAMQDFDAASAIFGSGETTLYVVLDGTDPLAPAFLAQLDTLTQRIAATPNVEQVLSLANVPLLQREGNTLAPTPLYDAALPAPALRTRFEEQPFLRGLLLSEEGDATLLMVSIEPDFNNTPERIELVAWIEAGAEALPGNAALAGLPHLRSQYGRRVTAEAPRFTLMALLISLLLLFTTFRAWRTLFLSTVVVLLGIVWTFGLMGLFDQKLNIVTAVLPALIVVIGMANSIHLTTKFFDQYALYGDRRKALLKTLQTVGLATFLTCFTTAIGFGVLVFSGSRLLIDFGLFAATGIMLLYVFSVTLIPFAYLRMRPPTARTTALATHDRFADFFDRLALFTQRRNSAILFTSLAIVIIGIIGVTRISSDIFVFSDFYEDDPLRQDLATFEKAFGGVLPMEVIVTANRDGQFRSLGNLRRLDRLQRNLEGLDEIRQTLSAADLVKMANQAYFGGHPATFRLPSSYELPFLQGALSTLLGHERDQGHLANLPRVVDTTFTVTRLYMGVGDLGTSHMNTLADTVRARTARLFPADRFSVTVTGNAVISTRSGESLVRNLLLSLGAALIFISLLMALLFRSIRLTLISLVPNVIPLLLVGGTMGFAGIALKPSTALIFSLAFGIAVDDTIHFLAKYRLIRDTGLPKHEAIRKTLRETGKAILFTSLVLMFGFLVFTFSSFGGTVNLGALTALTLGVALLANLLLLTALLHRFGPETHRPALRRDALTRNGHDVAPTLSSVE